MRSRPPSRRSPEDFTPWLRSRLRAFGWLSADAMRIWVDADACPNVIKEILVRAAERTRMQMTLVAGQPIQSPRSRWVTAVTVVDRFRRGGRRDRRPDGAG